MNYNVLSIIESSQVRSIAFSDVSFVADDMVGSSNIEYAIGRFVEPVVGRKLMTAVSRGEYDELKFCYLQSAVAFYVRYISAYDSEEETAKVLSRARHYLVELSQHLERCAAKYPEYSSADNILNRCRIHGNLVQVH